MTPARAPPPDPAARATLASRPPPPPALPASALSSLRLRSVLRISPVAAPLSSSLHRAIQLDSASTRPREATAEDSCPRRQRRERFGVDRWRASSFPSTPRPPPPSSAVAVALTPSSATVVPWRYTMRLLQAEELFRKVLEGASKKKSARLLGLDVGSKYVGLAVTDEQNRIALPLSVLSRTKTNINLMADDFNTLVLKYSLVGFVVGYPFNLHGQHSPDAVQVRVLAGELCKTGKLDDLCYTYWDENFTSKCVEALLHPLNLKNRDEAKTMTDKFAAVCILQGYLDNMNRKLRSADNSEA